MPDTERPEDRVRYVSEPLRVGPESVKMVIKRVLQLEQDRLYLQKPHLNKDVVRIIKEEVK